MTRRVIYPASNPPTKEGYYYVHWKDDSSETLLAYWDGIDWMSEGDFTEPEYWENAPDFPEFDQALVVGGEQS